MLRLCIDPCKGDQQNNVISKGSLAIKQHWNKQFSKDLFETKPQLQCCSKWACHVLTFPLCYIPALCSIDSKACAMPIRLLWVHAFSPPCSCTWYGIILVHYRSVCTACTRRIILAYAATEIRSMVAIMTECRQLMPILRPELVIRSTWSNQWDRSFVMFGA